MEKTEVMKPETLDDLIKLLHKHCESEDFNVTEVKNIMEAYDSNPQEWMKFAKFDPLRYTRNLVDKGNGKFNLILLCWGEGQGSSIHDHTNSHCFMKILKGELKETMFEWPDKKTHDGGNMVQKSQRILKENKCAYISDSIGLHRVENDSHTDGSVSLHLYSPPFDTCQTFDERTGHKNTVKMTFSSTFGEKTQPETTVSQENT